MDNYNTQLPQIKLPQYGRSIQRMVGICRSIEDRQKRTVYASTIVRAMGDLLRENNPEAEIQPQVLWDHLARISGYTLDIDYPYPVLPQEKVNAKPRPLPHPQHEIPIRNYGKLIDELAHKAMAEEQTEQRIMLFEITANQMKRTFLVNNPLAEEDDNKIIHDLLTITGGQFSDEIYQVYLHPAEDLKKLTQYDPAAQVVTKKKKKKKKK